MEKIWKKNMVQTKQAKKRRVSSISIVWLLPIFAIIIGAWMVYSHVSSQGPVIHLILQDADGIEAGKTKIKALNVDIGTITKLSFNKDYSKIKATAQMKKIATKMLTDTAVLWVVSPHISKDGITGLSTILTGRYISLQPGQPGPLQTKFKVKQEAPLIRPDQGGTSVILYDKDNLSYKLNIGDPILYNGYTVGKIVRSQFDLALGYTKYTLLINKPYNKLLHNNSVFWTSSGFSMSLTPNGATVNVSSLSSLLMGGVSFGLLAHNKPDPSPVKQNTVFKLYTTHDAAKKDSYQKSVYFILQVDDSNGLKAGAPVLYKGARVGTVVSAPYKLLSENKTFNFPSKISVKFKIDLGRVFQDPEKVNVDEFRQQVLKAVHNGLYATLDTQSLLTGELFVNLVKGKPLKKKQKLVKVDQYYVFPSKANSLDQIKNKVNTILDKISKLPIDKSVKELNNTLVQLQKTINGFSPNSSAYSEINSSLSKFNETLSDLNPLIKQLNRKPNSLIFGSDKNKDPIPVGSSK
ncbi:hypothetical protein CF386_11165 [Paraphotobacterium marinum]|uniref:Mce/MlaD domain-containing protein n=1 Tax=Paraphotobacterium marinum TaxID=1755811 RepID=A0A220VH75_9GAMM|nr:MlaD family protein [Paraphotobacterium marinum]ASK79606.1 hypothetical protein CF386_11165 [Paraphotobacterium marinum]